MSTIKVTNLQNASAASPAIVLDANSRATLNGLSYPTEGSLSGRNRIINGDMRIDQRNAGASVSFNSSNNFPVDRFKLYNTVGSGSTAQRSTTAPAEFNNSIVFTVGTGASPGAADECRFFQSVEGFNVADLGFGTALAKAVTVSFWVRSSITGTYAFNLRNDAGNRSYVATYSINSANTWEYKTTTIAGDTSGTWETGSSTGIMLRFDLGSGSNANTTAGTWQAGNFGRTSGSVNWIATNGATFYITGVQLEAGSVATPFERRSYGQELALCQRYYVKTGANRLAGGGGNTTTVVANMPIPVTLRSTPSVSGSTTSVRRYDNNAAGNEASGTLSVSQLFDNNVQVNISGLTSVSDNMTYWVNVSLNFSAEL